MNDELLTADEVSRQLKAIKPKQVRGLGLPIVRIGKGRGRVLYRQKDVDAYIRSRIEYEETPIRREHNAKYRAKTGHREMGIPEIVSWDQIQQARLGYTGRS